MKSTLVLANYASTTNVSGAASDDAKMFYTSTDANGATSNTLTIDVKTPLELEIQFKFLMVQLQLIMVLQLQVELLFLDYCILTTNGTDGYVLTSDGTGNVVWEAVSSSGCYSSKC